MRTYTLCLTVQAPNEVSHQRAAELVGQLIQVGHADAVETSQNPDFDNPDADQAAQLIISNPSIHI